VETGKEGKHLDLMTTTLSSMTAAAWGACSNDTATLGLSPPRASSCPLSHMTWNPIKKKGGGGGVREVEFKRRLRERMRDVGASQFHDRMRGQKAHR
jgi:hypothetical protein